MLDQHYRKVPDDLVVLPEIQDLTEEAISLVLAARWYDVRVSLDPHETDTIFLMASAEEIDYLEEIGLDELGGILMAASRINDGLKRRSITDGFYHV